MPTESATANIVGGGIAGVVAAVDLARAGVKVKLFEAAGGLGGRARTRNAGGYFLNQGPHALYVKGAFRRTLKRLGIAISGSPPKPNPPYGLYRGKLHPLPGDFGSLLSTGLFGLRDKLQFARVYQTLSNTTAEGSYADWLDAQHLRPAVRAAMEALARVSSYTNAPSEVRASATLEQIRFGIAGVIYVDGGWASLIVALADAAVEAGAELAISTPVERVAVEGRRTRVVLANGAEHVADATLLALGPNEAAALAPSVASLKQYAEDAIPVRANTLDLALERMPDRAKDFVLGIDRPTYFSLHSKAGKLAPEGGAVVHVAKYLPTNEKPGHDAITELEEIADIAMPGWRPLEKKRQELRGMPVVNAQVRADKPRPGVELADAPGLFIAGDWVGAEGMLSDAAAASGAEAAERIKAMLASGEVRSAA